MTGEDAARRRAAAASLTDPAFRARFAAAYRGSGDPGAALDRWVADEASERAAAALLYGRQGDAAARARAAESLARARREQRHAVAAVDAALAPPRSEAAPSPEAPAAAAEPVPSRGVPAPAARRPVPLGAVIAAAVVLLPVAYLAGAGTGGAAAPAATPTPTATPRVLPTAIDTQELAGGLGRIAYESPGDPRAAGFTAPPILGGYAVRAACLSSERRPRTVPAVTVQVLETGGRLIASWSAPCDGEVRRFPALAPAGYTRRGQIVLDFDDGRVRVADAMLVPNLS